MKKTILIGGPLAACLMLMACGGGGGSSGGGGSTGVTPTPTPTPTPAPSPNYAVAFDFTRDLSLTGDGVELKIGRHFDSATSSSQNIDSVTPSLGAAVVGVNYAASSRTAVFAYPAIIPMTFAGTTISLDSSDGRIYSITSPERKSLTIARVNRSTPYDAYAVVARFEQETSSEPATAPNAITDITRYTVVGSPTVSGDLRTTGTATYGGLAGGNAQKAGVPTRPTSYIWSSPQLRIDLATGAITGEFARAIDAPALRFSGTLDKATNTVEGTMTSGDSAFTGRFKGRLYGPLGIEVGIVFTLETPSGDRGAGSFIGRM